MMHCIRLKAPCELNFCVLAKKKKNLRRKCSDLGCCPSKGGGSVVIVSFIIVAPIVCGGFVFCVLCLFCYAVHSVPSGLQSFLMRNRKLVALLYILNCFPDVL